MRRISVTLPQCLCRQRQGAALTTGLLSSCAPMTIKRYPTADQFVQLQPAQSQIGIFITWRGRLTKRSHHKGTPSAEVQALKQAGQSARGATVYLNLEPGDCHGDDSAVQALGRAGVARAVIGIQHPLPHLRGRAITTLARAGIAVEQVVPEAAAQDCSQEEVERVRERCLAANEALLHRAALKQPLSVLKYAMTLDGKIATETGHSAWVSTAISRAHVFEQRALSDAVIVGGQTVRRDNPRLTTRRDHGHMPARIVMSRTLDLPKEANLWDVSIAPTIVMTQRGARQAFQEELRRKGVEVVGFDFLTPENVARYCYTRGFLRIFWECGGTLAAPAVASGVVHKVMAFVAPKIIGGERAPTPVGNLGFVEMTQAVSLIDPRWQPCGDRDMMVTGFLPSSGGLNSLDAELTALHSSSGRSHGSQRGSGTGSSAPVSGVSPALISPRVDLSRAEDVAEFYKPWDQWGALSNFSPHPINMPAGPGPYSTHAVQQNGTVTPLRRWSSVEHYYQAAKFGGVPEAEVLIESIAAAESPEQAAFLGRHAQRQQPHLQRSDWFEVQVPIMKEALLAKFRSHSGPLEMLLSTASWTGPVDTPIPLKLVENSPHDFFWGCGLDGSGSNMLGQLLMEVRAELHAEASGTTKNGLVSRSGREGLLVSPASGDASEAVAEA